MEVVVPRLESLKAYRSLAKSPDRKPLKLEVKLETIEAPLGTVKSEPGEMTNSTHGETFTYTVREVYKPSDAPDIKFRIGGLQNVCILPTATLAFY